MSDSLRLEVTGYGAERLCSALRLCPQQYITGVIWDGGRLSLKHEYDPTKPQKLAFKPELMVDIILDWLARDKGSNPNFAAPSWPEKPDVDGEVKKGWRVVADNHEIEIHPHWMIYHK